MFDIAAKLDTGAGGTVVHAEDIVEDGDRVRFRLPISTDAGGPGLLCEAPVSDRRRVTSSNGQGAMRVFIRTRLSLGGLPPREVEVSLAARHGMAFPLLVGREALAAWGVLVDPSG